MLPQHVTQARAFAEQLTATLLEHYRREVRPLTSVERRHARAGAHAVDGVLRCLRVGRGDCFRVDQLCLDVRRQVDGRGAGAGELLLRPLPRYLVLTVTAGVD